MCNGKSNKHFKYSKSFWNKFTLFLKVQGEFGKMYLYVHFLRSTSLQSPSFVIKRTNASFKLAELGHPLLLHIIERTYDED